MSLVVEFLPGVPADPLGLWQSLHPDPIHGFYLGSGAASDLDHLVYMSVGEPSDHFTMTSLDENSMLDHIQSELQRQNLPVQAPRFVGLVSFDAGRLCDTGIAKIPPVPDSLQVPLLDVGDYRSVVKLDYKKKETTIFSESQGMAAEIRRKIKKYNFHTPSKGKTTLGGRSKKLRGTPKKEFETMVISAKDAIARGDIYQANLSCRFEKSFTSSPLDLYRILCKKNPSPYSCLYKTADAWIVSCSPELLLSVQGDEIWTRPIAGTRPRGKNQRADQKRKGQLLLSPKERAEHIMLVDLERNDLGRVCDAGSVHVKDQFVIENYSHVMHIVSEVRGRLSPGVSSVEALKAVFPGGTITGCPKIKSIEIIQSLEKTSRGPFYGSVGYFGWDGSAMFNILIRTALVKNQRVYIQAGAGIVADSHPTREYKEVLAKAQVLLESI